MGKKNKVKIGTCKQCGKENIELYNGLCEKHYIEKQKRRKRNILLHDKEYVDTNDSKVHDNQNKYIPPENYGFTFEQIENRVLADCLTFKDINSIYKMIYQSPGGFSGTNSSLFYDNPTEK